MLLLVLLNHASFKTSLADWAACLKLLDSADEVGERFGLRRNLAGSAVPARVRVVHAG